MRHMGSLASARLGARGLWRGEQKAYLLSYVEARSASGAEQTYFLPLALAWESGDENVLRTAEWTLAKVREHARAGVLIDAFADPGFCISIANAVAANSRQPFAGGELRFERMAARPVFTQSDLSAVEHLGPEPTNTSVILGDALFLKAYRRAEPGPSPDVEMTSFLTRSGFNSIAALAGVVTHAAEHETVLAALFLRVGHQGDVWNYALNHLERFAAGPDAQGVAAASPHELFATQMHTLGRRLGEMHALLAHAVDDPAFAPEPVNTADLARWYSVTHFLAEQVLQTLQQRLLALPDAARAPTEELLSRRERLFGRIRELCSEPLAALKTRHHGNLHLGKVLLVANDVLMTGFEGNVSLPIDERRRKDSPLHDVATLLRSFDYARAAALEHATIGRPDLRERLEPALADWLQVTRAAFLAGYRRGVGDARHLPESQSDVTRLLTLFQLAHALRETRNELESRPAWVGTPVAALLALI
jgi:maltose alpha-D-glucosyltransferase/alpha-amylase